MLTHLKNYVYGHREGFSKAVGFVSVAYITKRYINDRLEEVKVRLEQERAARDILKRRFGQVQEDVSYTALALLSTLTEQVLKDMDIEALTSELQSRTRAGKHRQHLRPPSSVASSVDVVQEHDVRSDNGSVAPSVASTGFSLAEAPETTTSSPESNILVRSGTGLSATASSAPLVNSTHSDFVIPARTHESTTRGDSASVDSSGLSEGPMSSSILSESGDVRSKAELWNEVKMLTLTRTLTTLYSTTLLCLLTTIQLTLLARAKYTHAIVQQERDERTRERLESELTLTKLLLGGRGLENLMSGDFNINDEGEDTTKDGVINDEVESKYLTLSWWLLHVGWKDVGERVRRGVEEVFDGVSLKTKLNIMDFHHLISDVRRRVEHEITFEGNERKIDFLSTLLPPTPEMIQHVLVKGGFYSDTTSIPQPDRLTIDSSTSLSSSQLSHSNYFLSAFQNLNPNPAAADLTTLPLPNPYPHTEDLLFTSLVDETRSVITSSDFAFVLEACLDRVTELLFDALEKNVFVDSKITPGEEVRIRLAGLLPGLSKWSSLALRSLPNQLVDAVLSMREVSCLSAITFAKFENKFR